MYNRELITFITVAMRGSFLRAARELYTTPASVMNQMNKLERMVGVKLLERGNQGTRLTAAGKSLYKDAKRMVEFADEAVKKARQLADVERNVIRVGTSILRPCKRLLDLWKDMDGGASPFQVSIVPFDDDPIGLESVLSGLGKRIDCIVTPCDSEEWRRRHSILHIGTLPCRVGVPRKHRLARKKRLRWPDLDGETLMIVRSGDTPVLKRLRDDISENHPQIRIADVSNFYDTSAFNECERMNYLMETLDIWEEVHPSLVTLPMEWEYEIPYGIVYAKRPSEQMKTFIDAVQKAREAGKQM